MSESSEIKVPVAAKDIHRRNRLLAALAVVVVLAVIAAALYWQLHGRHFVSTDNAYAAVEIAQVTPTVDGTVKELRVTDTQLVHKGDVLVVIDPADAQLALIQAEAELGRAIRRVKAYAANDYGLQAQVQARDADEMRAAAQLRAAQADLERAKIDLQRREALVGSGSVSGEELTKVRNAYLSADAALASTKAQAAQSRANRSAAIGSREANAALITHTTEENNPEVVLARARRDRAALDLERTLIRAPLDGIVARSVIQLGQQVKSGTPLLSVVPVQKIHIDANYKEVQLEAVRIGQTALVQADIYGSSVTYHGTVEGFSGGSGAAFSAIPAQNATGNWIKVVQRLPVRIRLAPEELAAHPLKVGMSMSVTIDTRTHGLQ